MEEAYITLPKGFKAAGVSAGMKCTDPANINKDDPKSSYLDMALIVSDLPANGITGSISAEAGTSYPLNITASSISDLLIQIGEGTHNGEFDTKEYRPLN